MIPVNSQEYYSKFPRTFLGQEIIESLLDHNGPLLVFPLEYSHMGLKTKCYVCNAPRYTRVRGIWEKASICTEDSVFVLCEQNYDTFGKSQCRQLFNLNPLAYE